MVRRVMKSRSWWREIAEAGALCHFIWKPFSNGIHFESLLGSRLVVNHFENHKELSQKYFLFLNLKEYSEVSLVMA